MGAASRGGVQALVKANAEAAPLGWKARKLCGAGRLHAGSTGDGRPRRAIAKQTDAIAARWQPPIPRPSSSLRASPLPAPDAHRELGLPPISTRRRTPMRSTTMVDAAGLCDRLWRKRAQESSVKGARRALGCRNESVVSPHSQHYGQQGRHLSTSGPSFYGSRRSKPPSTRDTVHGMWSFPWSAGTLWGSTCRHLRSISRPAASGRGRRWPDADEMSSTPHGESTEYGGLDSGCTRG